MGALCSTQSDVYVEHGSAIAQDVVLSIIDTANTTVGNASRTKGETAPVLWKVVEHNGSSLDVPEGAAGAMRVAHIANPAQYARPCHSVYEHLTAHAEADLPYAFVVSDAPGAGVSALLGRVRMEGVPASRGSLRSFDSPACSCNIGPEPAPDPAPTPAAAGPSACNAPFE